MASGLNASGSVPWGQAESQMAQGLDCAQERGAHGRNLVAAGGPIVLKP